MFDLSRVFGHAFTIQKRQMKKLLVSDQVDDFYIQALGALADGSLWNSVCGLDE